MQENRREIGDPPRYFECDPLSRAFPPEWKDIWFRRLAVSKEDGTFSYVCPLCRRGFDHALIHHLHGDHVWPYSLFGETSWNNYQLICGNCNESKSNKLDTEVRRILGGGEFRRIVHEFLRSQIEAGRLTDDLIFPTFPR
jgi:hypothetical protein